MRKAFIYIVLIGLSFFAPLERADIARLQPIEAIGLLETDGQITIITDTGDRGSGNDMDSALNDLIKNTPGIVYLDTAKYLLASEDVVSQIEYLRDDLKQSVELCLWDGKGELKDAVKYLSVHGDFPQLRKWKQGDKLPIFVSEK